MRFRPFSDQAFYIDPLSRKASRVERGGDFRDQARSRMKRAVIRSRWPPPPFLNRVISAGDCRPG